jgi:hypothetical protein
MSTLSKDMRSAGRGRIRRVELDGEGYALRRWSCDAGPVLAVEAEPGSPLPSYAQRRMLRAKVVATGPARRMLFTDAARLSGVWSWMEREEGGPLAYRERRWDFREPDTPPDQPESTDRPGESHGSPAARRAVRSALVRKLRQDGEGLSVLHPECADPGQLLQDMIERTTGPNALRRIWRATERLRVLDAACRAGDWLAGAGEALSLVYLASLERMDTWVSDAARGGVRSSRRSLSDFRATLAICDDTHRWPSRRRYARELALARNLRGADGDPEMVATAALRLERWARGDHPQGPGTPLMPLILRAGRFGPGAAKELRRDAMTGGPPGAGGEGAEATHRAGALLRRCWLEEGAMESAAADAARDIRARLDALSCGPPGDLHPGLEYRDVLAGGGFDLVRRAGR